MSENLRNYTKAIYALDAVVRRVPAESWDNRSPCEEWTAREVLGHSMWGINAMAATAAGADRPPEMAEADVAGPDPQVSWNQCRDSFLAAVDNPGAIHRVMDGPLGPMALDAGLGFFFADPLAHAWDVAQAAGIESCLPSDLCELATANLAGAGDGIRGPGRFGPQQDVAEGASAEAHFIAMAGRLRS